MKKILLCCAAGMSTSLLVNKMKAETKKRGIEVRILTSSVPAVIEASDSELRMATVNVMQNAFHAMKDGGVLEISVIASDEVISVSRIFF